jgi:hypothetical protein
VSHWKRNHAILERAKRGIPVSVLARAYGLSKQQIWAILAELGIRGGRETKQLAELRTTHRNLPLSCPNCIRGLHDLCMGNCRCQRINHPAALKKSA